MGIKLKKTNQISLIWRKYPSYKYLTYTNILTGLTSWGSFIAMLVLLNQITDNGIQLGMLWAVSGLAPLMFSFLVGFLVDRFNPKKVIVFSEVFRGILFLGYIVVPLLGGMYAWILFCLLRFVGGLLNSLATIARQTIIPDLIEEDDLIVANSFNFTITSSIRLLGAAAGGTLISFLDLDIAWMVTSLSFFVSAIISSRITLKNNRKMVSSKNIKKEFVVGIQVIKEQKFVKLVLLAALSGGIIIGSFNLMLEQFVSNVYETKHYGISLLYISEGIISVLVGYWLANNKFLFKNPYKYGYVYILMGLTWTLFGFTEQLYQGAISLMLFAFVGAFIVPFERQIMQTDVPAHLRGRLFGLWNTCSLASIQVGAFLTGVFIYYFGIRSVPILTSVLEVGLGIFFIFYVKKHIVVGAAKQINTTH
ncbi:major facilitator superfamily macrolide-efflux protein [Paenibacillus vortex V453]|uniref:MFS transporter n=3 Tax=Paenibacillus TaxID=44249 RepID=A0A163JSH5_9BACL|nr:MULTISPECIES: MFS transporter [Paenibacillus]EFU42983.1 major facilitator superfamily macrolide-efflux protein [Paenibacillus vortex V453]KZS46774.1 MFS transporter [Paenibacillus glucanolyticus]MDH6671609.1 DHA3 family macrolide efflux protein-like MFS transporter [Paenibacillus sp. LBL]